MIVNKYQGNGGGGGGSYVLPTATANRLGGIKVGSGLTVENDGTLSTSGSTYELPVASDQVLGGVKVGSGLTIDPIILEEHYDDQEWLPIYNAVAQSAVTMGVDEFAKNYDIYLIRNDGGFYQAVGYAIQEGEDDGVTTNWLKFYTFDNGGYTYWLLSTGSRGIGAIGGFDNNMPHPKSAWITIDTSGNVIGNETNINDVDEGLAQYPDHGTDYAFSMYLCCLVSDAERYRGNLQNYRKNYNGVNGNHFFRFIIDIDGTEYEAEYYYDTSTGEIVKIVFQTYKAYLQGVLNS